MLFCSGRTQLTLTQQTARRFNPDPKDVEFKVYSKRATGKFIVPQGTSRSSSETLQRVSQLWRSSPVRVITIEDWIMLALDCHLSDITRYLERDWDAHTELSANHPCPAEHITLVNLMTKM